MNTKNEIKKERRDPGHIDRLLRSMVVDEIYWQGLADKTTDGDKRKFFEDMKSLVGRRGDEIRIALGRTPVTEEGKELMHISNDITRLTRIWRWTVKNITPIAGVGTLVATVVYAAIALTRSTTKTVQTAAKTVSKVSKVVVNTGRKIVTSAGPVVGPIVGGSLSLIGHLLSITAMIAKFVGEHLWLSIVALVTLFLGAKKKLPLVAGGVIALFGGYYYISGESPKSDEE